MSVFPRSRHLWSVALGALLLSAGCGNRTESLAVDEDYHETARQFYLGLASLEVGLLVDAVTQLEAAATLSPAEPAVPANLVVAHLRLGEESEALAWLQRARELEPDNAEIVLLAGLAARFGGRFDDAAQEFRAAVERDPDLLFARYALAQELRQQGDEAAAREAQEQLDAILDRQPDNLPVLVEHARLAAEHADGEALARSAAQLREGAGGWPEPARAQLERLEGAVEASVFDEAITATALLRNVLLRLGGYQDGLAEVAVDPELIASPFARFLRLPAPPSGASPADETLAFVAEPLSDAAAATVVTVAHDSLSRVIVSNDNGIGSPGAPQLAAFATTTGPSSIAGLLSADWTNDFLADLALAGPGGLRLLVQDGGGGFTDQTPPEPVEIGQPAFGVWGADLEMDGDLDLVVAPVTGPPVALQNNADGTWTSLPIFQDVEGLRAFAWSDFDVDGDPDAAIIDQAGQLVLYENQQAGQFRRWAPPTLPNLLTLVAGELDGDRQLDLGVIDGDGGLWRVSHRDAGWTVAELADWTRVGQVEPGQVRLLVADLDNNGASDLLASGPSGTDLWQRDPSGYRHLAIDGQVEVHAVADLDGDGRLDLVGVEDGGAVQLLGRGEADYHWQVVRARALEAAGDQRINAFGVGGEIEVRAGLLSQKQPIQHGLTHFGLGVRESVDVVRIAWPNGVVQAEFPVSVDQTVQAEQRLKGSCPWVFAHDGEAMRFVTDFLWRSPLGLRINAQDTAGVTQTEDWIRIRGDQLRPVEGEYELSITAELWETHFFDHVSLMVVDHPAETDVFVDERFAANQPPALELHATGVPRPLRAAWDDLGEEVTDVVALRDGRYVSSFGQGPYQGVTRDHYLEVELDVPDAASPPSVLLAYGWVYPTDSSINVALAQGAHEAPRGVSLEAQSASGGWTTVHADLGFPSGKNKTLVIDLTKVPWHGERQRLRLRTNLEVYWDWVGVTDAIDPSLRTERLAPRVADLRYRGFSRTHDVGPRGPEVPRYDELANTAPRWRDLVGYHTRFGDVRPLLSEVDDRYVIMNAGDELTLTFTAPREPPEGWRRDFVLIGDGWVKDGDFNTGFSKTVLPLPSHDDATYTRAPTMLEADPVFQRHRGDWERFHTRYVTPSRFLGGLGSAGPSHRSNVSPAGRR